MKVNEVMGRLQGCRFEPGCLERLEELTDELRGCEDAEVAVGPVLRFIEEHPSEELGAPGPLVHFVEQFHRRGYEEQLMDSVGRKPTELNLWMLNRLINRADGAEKDRYVSLLRHVAGDQRTEAAVRAVADEFLSFQQV